MFGMSYHISKKFFYFTIETAEYPNDQTLSLIVGVNMALNKSNYQCIKSLLRIEKQITQY